MNTSALRLRRFVASIAGAIALAWAAEPGVDASAPVHQTCRQGDRGRLIGYRQVASYPTLHDARAHFEAWIAFYQDYYQFS